MVDEGWIRVVTVAARSGRHFVLSDARKGIVHRSLEKEGLQGGETAVERVGMGQ
jgi:hypothetical protein